MTRILLYLINFPSVLVCHTITLIEVGKDKKYRSTADLMIEVDIVEEDVLSKVHFFIYQRD